jgi:phage shock protein C
MLAGVAGGMLRYLNADVTLVRVIIAALVLFTGAGVALYVAAWLLIPRGRRGSPAAGTASANPHDDQNRD